MAKNGADAAEEYRKMEQQWADEAKEAIDTHETQLENCRAFKARIEDANKDELKELFGDVMSDARTHHRDVVEARIWLSDGGEIDKMASVPMSANAFADVSPDLSFRVGCDSFLSYDDIRQAVRSALAQSIAGAKSNLEDAKHRVEQYDHGI